MYSATKIIKTISLIDAYAFSLRFRRKREPFAKKAA